MGNARPRPRLDRDAVLRAGLDIVDRDGLDALTMRALARQLGVTPMALYNHVADRADLVDGIAELVAREMAPRRAAPDWQASLRTRAEGMRCAYLAHPHAVRAVQDARSATPALLAPMHAVVGALRAAGFSEPDAHAGWMALVALVNGHVAYQLAGHLRGTVDFDGAFSFAVDALIAGLDQARPRQKRPSGRRPSG